MFSLKNFTLTKWLILTAFLFSFTFFIAYFTGWTGESKHLLKSNSSLIRRSITALGVGLVISFINADRKK